MTEPIVVTAPENGKVFKSGQQRQGNFFFYHRMSVQILHRYTR